MKITKVTIHNINSIRGKHTIDFVKSFSNHGLFLLTGDTGAGKTTILDAISIALYGETPRLKSKHELEQLISIGEKDTLAEVEFVVDNNLYKSKWSINVARTGTINDSKRELSRYIDGTFELITSAKKGFNEKIEDITNLNFDRFTKTVMLAQGSFDAFLQAKDAEKSDLLEKITGTQIYQKISQRVFEKERDERVKLTQLAAKMDGFNILEDKEVKEKTLEIDSANKQSNDLAKEIKELQNITKTVENISKYKKEIESLTKEKITLQTKKEEFKEDAEKLENSLKAKDIYTQISVEKNLTKEFSDKKKEKENLEKSKIIFLDELKEIDIKVKMSDDELAKFTKVQKSKLKDIDSANELLVNQKNIENILDTNIKELDKKEKNHSVFLKNIDEDTNKKSKLEKSLETIVEFSLSFENQKKSLSQSLQKLENEVAKIDRDKLFKDKNILENRLKDIKEFLKFKDDKVKQDKILEDTKLKLEPQSKVVESKVKKIEELSMELEKLEALKLSALSIQNYEESRKSLKNDEECPLCGSCDHPYLINMPKFDDKISTDLFSCKNSLKTMKTELKKDELELHKINTSVEVAIATLKTTKENLVKFNIDKDEKVEHIEEKLKELDSTIKNSTLKETDLKKAVKELKEFEIKEQKAKDEKIELRNSIKLLQSVILNNNKQIISIKSEIEILKAGVKKQDSELLEIVSNITKLLNSKTMEQFKKELDEEEIKLSKQSENLKKIVIETIEKITINKTTIESLEKNLVELSDKIKIVELEITRLLEEKGFKSIEEVLSLYIKDEDKIKELVGIKKSIEDEDLKIQTLLKSTKESLEVEFKKEVTTTASIEELLIKEKELSQKRDEINKNATVTEEELKLNDNIKKQQAITVKEIDAQKIILTPWEILNKLIGNAKGEKYQKFVQNLTLGHLLSLANNHLFYLSDRYRLVRTNNEKLDISIIDRYYIDKQRGVNTLSGGERFLVSLALALGLSDLVNDKIKVDSLFLDEGFGTLDEDSLNMAINALEKLHAKGKLIGVISHVALLKERIYAQIQLKKKSGGSSEIVVVG